jgi:hypothetical protein
MVRVGIAYHLLYTHAWSCMKKAVLFLIIGACRVYENYFPLV